MILKNALELSKSIDNHRLDMYELARKKCLSDPDVVKISTQLDRKIIMLQKMLYAVSS